MFFGFLEFSKTTSELLAVDRHKNHLQIFAKKKAAIWLFTKHFDREQ